MFPFVSVGTCPQEKMTEAIGPTLVCTAITDDEAFQQRLMDCTHIDRLQSRADPHHKARLAAARRGQHHRLPLSFAGAGQVAVAVGADVTATAPTTSFEVHAATRLVVGPGPRSVALGETGPRDAGGPRLVVSDPGVAEGRGMRKRGISSLEGVRGGLHALRPVRR